jgi:hypothetical protein
VQFLQLPGGGSRGWPGAGSRARMIRRPAGRTAVPGGSPGTGRRTRPRGQACGPSGTPGPGAVRPGAGGSSMAVPVCRSTQSVVPPLETMRPRLLGRSRSGTSRPRISSARAAVSYSIRHSALSRSGTSSRQIAATCARVSALVVSTGTFGRAHPAVGSAATQSASAHQASAERNADRCRARVAGASPPPPAHLPPKIKPRRGTPIRHGCSRAAKQVNLAPPGPPLPRRDAKRWISAG